MSFSFGQLGRIEVTSATIYLHDVVILVWLLSSVRKTIENVNRWFGKQKWKTWWPLLAFAGWLLLGMIIAFTETKSIVPWMYLGRLVFYCLFLVSLLSALKQYPIITKVLLVSSGMYMVWFGLLQYFLIPDSRYLLLYGWDEHYYRLIGPLLDPNLSGILYVMMGWALISLRQFLPKKLIVSSIVLLCSAIVLTYSRATYLAAALSFVAYFAFQSKQMITKKSVGLAIMALLLLVVAVYQLAPKPGGDGVNLFRTTSITARIQSTQRYISSLEPYQWVIGTGFYSPLSNTASESHAQVPDNLLVLVLVNMGVVGLLLFFTVFTKWYKLFSRWDAETKAAVIAVLVHSQFNNSLLEPFVFLCLGLVIISQTRKSITE
jgi:hypothetical protein